MNFTKLIPKRKSDWAILILIGVLMMIVVIPVGGESCGTKEESGGGQGQQWTDGEGGAKGREQSAEGREKTEEEGFSQRFQSAEDYARFLEERLADILSKTKGVGRVEVMVTLKDRGEEVIDKNIRRDGAAYQADSVLRQSGEESAPYVKGQQYPAVEGVAVIAEGAEDPETAAALSETVLALFPVAAHRVKILPKG